MPSPGGPMTTTRPSCFAAASVRSHSARQSPPADALAAGEAGAAASGVSLRGAAAGAPGAAQAASRASPTRVAVRPHILTLLAEPRIPDASLQLTSGNASHP